MNKEFIPYEQALKLKELGFDEPCMAYYELNNKEVQVVGVNQRYNDPSLLTITDFCAPLYQQAFRWFRERVLNRIQFETDYMEGAFVLLPLMYMNKYEILVLPYSTSFNYDIITGEKIPYYGKARFVFTNSYPTYEEAELACLTKLIKLILETKGGEVFSKNSDIIIEIAKNK